MDGRCNLFGPINCRDRAGTSALDLAWCFRQREAVSVLKRPALATGHEEGVGGIDDFRHVQYWVLVTSITYAFIASLGIKQVRYRRHLPNREWIPN